MEKVLSDNERIRRAEEIYFRRNNKFPEKKIGSNSGGKNNILFHLLVMFNLAVIVFSVQNKNYIFTNEFLEKIDSYNFSIGNKIKELLISEEIETSKQEEKENEVQNELIVEEKPEIIVEEQTSSISEMDIDVENLKNCYSFICPLENYQVSSGFGARESEFQNVSGYHTGIDLASKSGNAVIASMEGIVELVSSKGDYGKHIKIRSNNVTTLYAHCSKISVKEGQIVAQGQPIGSVGSTGNSTGPHLHFEIRVDDRFVDPSKIINF